DEDARQAAQREVEAGYARLTEYLGLRPGTLQGWDLSAPRPLQRGVAFPAADGARWAAGPHVRVILQRVPAGADVPRVPDLPCHSNTRFDVFLDSFDPARREEVAGRVAVWLGCSPEEAAERLSQPVVMLLRGGPFAEAARAVRSFHG